MPGRQDIFQQAMDQASSAAWDRQWEDAAKYYQQALDEFPNNPQALNNLGMALYTQGKYDEALPVYQRASQVAPEDPLASEKVAQTCERLNKIQEAVQASLKAADLFLKNRDTEKAVSCWLRVLRLDPFHLNAHSRLAVIYERIGRKAEAVNEYLSMAYIMQQSGLSGKAAQVIDYSIQLQPGNTRAEEAAVLLRSGQELPKPQPPRGSTAPLKTPTGNLKTETSGSGSLMSRAGSGSLPPPRGSGSLTPQPDEEASRDGKFDPVGAAKQQALIRLAQLLFEQEEENPGGQVARRGLQAIMRGTGALSLEQVERNKVMTSLGQAIDAQSKGNDALAAEELEKAINAGLNHTAAYFDLGLLRYQNERLESATQYLQHATKHPDFAMASHILLGQALKKMNRPIEASVHFLEAFKLADAELAPSGQGDELKQLYEPIIEGQSKSADSTAAANLCDVIVNQLASSQWKHNLQSAREQLGEQSSSGPLTPLVEVFMQVHSSSIIDSLLVVKRLGNRHLLRTAMEEAYYALQFAPTYLPLHIQMAELLVEQGMIREAIEKYMVVANTFSSRGEFGQTTQLLRKVVALAPMDLAARSRLIEQLVLQGTIPEAVEEYIDLAEIYSRLAELDMARKTLANALKLTQSSPIYQGDSVKILYLMADIDMQRLEWRQALKNFEQIRTLDPGDAKVRANLIDLNMRMGQDAAAISELDSYISFLESSRQQNRIIPFLEDLVKEHPDTLELHQRLAEYLRQAGKITEAVSEFDRVGDILMDSGNIHGVIAVIQTIISLNPPNVTEYRGVLDKLKGSL